jgi:ketosteroid isomerase-like protein
MSAENVAVVRRMYEDFGRGDIPGVLAALDPEIEWIESDEEFMPQRGTHVGPDAVAESVLGSLPMNFDEFAAVPLAFHDAGEVVVVEGRTTGITKAGGKLDAPVAWVWTVRDGKVVRNVNYHDTDAWREALGA